MPTYKTSGYGRTLAIGDIHGCLMSLQSLAAAVSFQPTDRLILLGDYVDRGPDSRGVLDWILEQRATMEVIALRGNHEVMMLEARTNRTLAATWSSFGGLEALESYGTSFTEDWVPNVPKAHWEFLSATRRYFETEHFIFVHGSLDGTKALTEQNPYTLIWGRCHETKPHFSGKRVICGHTPHKDGKIGTYDFGVCIDTAACSGGWLTCLNPETGEFWQANELGTRQGGKLDRV
jgi:serine/threonine protein phosphatase 1